MQHRQKVGGELRSPSPPPAHQLAEPAEISVLLLTSGVGDGPDNGKTGQMHVPVYAGIMAHEMCRYLKYLPFIKVWPVFQKENSPKELASAHIVCATVEMAHRLWRAGKLKLDSTECRSFYESNACAFFTVIVTPAFCCILARVCVWFHNDCHQWSFVNVQV